MDFVSGNSFSYNTLMLKFMIFVRHEDWFLVVDDLRTEFMVELFTANFMVGLLTADFMSRLFVANIVLLFLMDHRLFTFLHMLFLVNHWHEDGKLTLMRVNLMKGLGDVLNMESGVNWML